MVLAGVVGVMNAEVETDRLAGGAERVTAADLTSVRRQRGVFHLTYGVTVIGCFRIHNHWPSA